MASDLLEVPSAVIPPPLTWNWHTICLVVYLFICVGDFFILPMATALLYYNVDPMKIAQIALMFQNPTTQLAVMESMKKATVWEPLTLRQNGMFHIAFGSILGIGAWKRTQKDSEPILFQARRPPRAVVSS